MISQSFFKQKVLFCQLFLLLFLAGISKGFSQTAINNECASAITLTITPGAACDTTNLVTYSTAGATQSLPGCDGIADDDVWFKFVATSTSHLVTITPTFLSPDAFTITQVFSGNCINLISITCTPNQHFVLSGLTPGNTYFVREYTFGEETVAEFKICIATAPPSPANDNCPGAVSVPISNQNTCDTTALTTYSTLSATQSMPGCSGISAKDDVWFNFVATSPYHAFKIITTASSPEPFMAFEVFRGSCNNLISLGCFSSGEGVVNGLITGNSYFIRVHTSDTNSLYGIFKICISIPSTPPPVNDECTGSIALSVNSEMKCDTATLNTYSTQSGSESLPACDGEAKDDVWFRFVATNTSHIVTLTSTASSPNFDLHFEVFSGSCNSLTSIFCSGNKEAIIRGLVVNNTYFIRVHSFNYSRNFFSLFKICIGTPPPAPANDLVCNAVALTYQGNSHCANTLSATSTNDPDLPGSCSVPNNTTWYTYTPATNGPIGIKMKKDENSSAPLNAILGLYTVSGNCNAFVFAPHFQCYYANLITRDSITISTGSLIAGTTYYIMVDGEASLASGEDVAGNYCISITAPPAFVLNDSCGSPVTILEGSTISGNFNGATSSIDHDPEYCNGFTFYEPKYLTGDVWYSFTTNATGSNANISLKAIPSFFDPIIEVYSGEPGLGCNGLTKINCSNTGFPGEAENLALSGLNANTTYFIAVYGFSDARSMDGAFEIEVTGDITLPVTLTQFKAQKIGKINKLTWTTNSEKNNKGFQIERSPDGKNFSSIAFIVTKAKNSTNSSVLDYSYTDQQPFTNGNYYRLKQTDIDGRTTLSDIVVVKGEDIIETEIVRVYPSPAYTEINIMVNAAKTEKTVLVITDLAGRITMQIPMALRVGVNLFNINTSTLNAGSYIIKSIPTTGKSSTPYKFIKL